MRVQKQQDDRNAPFEIHIVRFSSETEFANYQADAETLKLSERREQIIVRTKIFQSLM